MIYKIIHITGASGSGTTTLAKAIHDKCGYIHYDTDDFFWESTDPPFLIIREVSERQNLLKSAIDKVDKCVISGSLTEWGDIFIPQFDLVIYVYTPRETRLERLHKRELLRFGSRILPKGDMFDQHKKFLEWAAQYDNGGKEMRSATHHAEWLKQVACPVKRVDGTMPTEKILDLLHAELNLQIKLQ